MLIRYLNWALCCLLFTALQSMSAERVLYPFDNAFPKGMPVAEQVELLAELGYGGLCTRPGNATPELFAELDKHGLKAQASYVVFKVADGKDQVPQWVAQHVRDLKGRDTIVWLSLLGKDASEADAALAIQRLYDLCQANDVELVLYPHYGFYTDTAMKCARLRELSGRPGVGLSLTLCHFLRQNNYEDLEATVRALAPHLRLVQISGGNESPMGLHDWSHYIKPLGEGSFDMRGLLELLDEVGYEGSFNLQCYNLTGPAHAHLSASMQAWKNLNQ